MKIKTKIISLVLLLSILSLSLSSCLFFDTVSEISGANNSNSTNPSVKIEEVKNYDITIEGAGAGSEIAAAKALLSAVSIKTDTASGSGVIFKLSDDKTEAYVLTNYHVIYNSKTHAVSKNIKAYLYGMESHLYGDDSLNYAMEAQYVGGTVNYDLAVLKIKNSKVLMESSARACDFADSNNVQILETAIAVGNAVSGGISVTMGRVNVDSEDIQLLAADDKTVISIRVMRTDAAVNPGNSGGGLFNAKGELIGIVNAKSSDVDMDNIGFAIPSNVAKYIAQNILYYCDGTTHTSAFRCMLGINVQIAELYTEYDEETGVLHRKERVEVLSIASDTSAAKDILMEGDVINSITIDGKVYEVTRMFHVVDAMLNARATSSVKINVTRGTQELELDIPFDNDDIIDADS